MTISASSKPVGLVIYNILLIKAEERLKIIEEQMKIDQEKQKLKRKEEKRARNEQKKILGKDNSRPKLSFALSSAI